MNTETTELSAIPQLHATPDQSTTHQLRVEGADSTATHPHRQSLDYSHQAFSSKPVKKMFPPSQKSQSEAGMGLYIMDIFGRPTAAGKPIMDIEEEEREIDQNKKNEDEDVRQSNSEIIELPEIEIDSKKFGSEENVGVDEIDKLHGAINQPVPIQREPSRQDEHNVHEIHEMWVANPDLQSHRTNQAGSEESAAFAHLGSNPDTRRHSRQNSRRLRNQPSNSRITVLGQVEDMHYEAWLDFDAIQARENRALRRRITQAVEGRYYRKIGLFFLELILFVVCFLIALDVIAIQVLPVIIAIVLIVVAVYAASQITREDFTEKENRWKILRVVDWLTFAQYGLCVTLKIQGDLKNHLYFSTFPGFAVVILYLTFIQLPRTNKVGDIIIRALLWVQLLLLSLKIDEIIDITWNLTFVISWFICIALVVATVVAFGFLVVNLYLYTHREQPPQSSRSMPIKWQVLSVGINFGMLLVSVFMLITLVTFTKYMDGNTSLRNVLKGTFLAGLVYTIIEFALAIGYRKTLKQFFRDDISGSPEYKPAPGQRVLAFKTEDLKETPTFFSIISPTYFLLFDQSLLLGEQQNLAKLKGYMTKLKDRVKEVIKRKAIGEKISIEELKKEIKSKKPTETNNNDISLQIPSEKANVDTDHHNCETEHVMLSLSVDDKENVGRFKGLRNAALNIEEAEETEQLCFVCYERTANSIFMNCGHGGICSECAQETWNKKSSCITCRERISEVIKYVPIKGMRMVRAVARTKRVYEVIRSRTFVPSNH